MTTTPSGMVRCKSQSRMVLRRNDEPWKEVVDVIQRTAEEAEEGTKRPKVRGKPCAGPRLRWVVCPRARALPCPRDVLRQMAAPA